MRDSLSAANCEGKRRPPESFVTHTKLDKILFHPGLILDEATYQSLPSHYSSGLIGRAMPHDRDSPHHTPYKDAHHHRGSISQGRLTL